MKIYQRIGYVLAFTSLVACSATVTDEKILRDISTRSGNDIKSEPWVLSKNGQVIAAFWNSIDLSNSDPALYEDYWLQGNRAGCLRLAQELNADGAAAYSCAPIRR
jgi:hypothetical protein